MAVDSDKNAVEVPGLLVETEEEKGVKPAAKDAVKTEGDAVQRIWYFTLKWLWVAVMVGLRVAISVDKAAGYIAEIAAGCDR